jgi:hypothetical protein
MGAMTCGSGVAAPVVAEIPSRTIIPNRAIGFIAHPPKNLIGEAENNEFRLLRL